MKATNSKTNGQPAATVATPVQFVRKAMFTGGKDRRGSTMSHTRFVL
jgi:hypothetical protein